MDSVLKFLQATVLGTWSASTLMQVQILQLVRLKPKNFLVTALKVV